MTLFFRISYNCLFLMVILLFGAIPSASQNLPKPSELITRNKTVFTQLFEKIELARRQGNNTALYKLYNSLASSYYTNNDYVSSLNYYNKALTLFQGHTSSEEYIDLLLKTGSIQGEMGNSFLAYKIFLKAIAIIEKKGNNIQTKKYRYYNNIANELYRMNKPDEAAIYFHKCLAYGKANQDNQLIGKALFGLSRIDVSKQRFKDAYKNAIEAHALLSQSQADRKTIMISKLNLSNINIRLKKYNAAMKFASEVYEEATAANDLKILMDAAYHLKTLSYETKDYQSAVNYLELHQYLKDSLFNLNRKMELFTNTLNYEFDQKIKKDSLRYLSEHQKLENEIKLSHERQRSNNIIFIAVGIGVSGILLFYFYALRQNRHKQEMEYERKLSEAKISTLVAQINPHFVFNSLNSILSFIQNSNKEEALKYLSKFSKIVRMILEGCDKQTVSINDEIHLLRLYIELEQLRNDHQFDFTIEVSPQIDRFNTEIPVMMLQPYIENAILHGIQNKISLAREIKVSYRGQLAIKYTIQNDKILCSVKDNGVGRKKSRELTNETLFTYKSKGVEFAEERLVLLTKNNCSVIYNDLYDHETSEPLGTEVLVELPVMN